MKNRLYHIFLLFWILISISACSDGPEKELENKPKVENPVEKKKEEEKKPKTPKVDEYTEEKVDLGLSKEDEKLLLLQESFPIGTDFKKIHDELGIKGVRPEGGLDELAAQGLTESKTKRTLLNKNVEIEFNFKNDSLYSFYYTINEPDFDEGERIYKGLQQFYNKKLGNAYIPPAEEETRHIRTSLWREKFPYGVLNYNVHTGQISWGFQNTKP